jgi:hypothetical protein
MTVPDEISAWPLAVALALTSIVPNVAWLTRLEEAIRWRAHELAFIPDGVREIANQLRVAPLAPPEGAIDAADPLLRGVHRADFAESRANLLHRWARASLILAKIVEMRDGDGDNVVDADFLDAHDDQVSAFVKEHRFLQEQVLRFRSRQGEADPSDPGALDSEVSNFVTRLTIFLSCGARAKKASDAEVANALRRFGFDIRDLPAASTFLDRHWRSMAAVALSTFIGSLAGFYFLRGGRYASHAGVLIQAAEWSIMVLLLHGTAAFAASRYRDRALARGAWERRPTQIAAAAWWGGLSGVAAMTCWTLLVHNRTWLQVALALPWGILGALTAGFVAYFLSTKESDLSRRRSVIEGARQGTATAIAVVLVLEGLRELGEIIPSARAAPVDADYLTFAAVLAGLGLLIGASIGLFLPRERRLAKPYENDPYARARLEDMERRRTRQLRDPEAARDWLAEPILDCGGLIPFRAARSLVESEKVFDWLKKRETPISANLDQPLPPPACVAAAAG